jgi:hypothetical protein
LRCVGHGVLLQGCCFYFRIFRGFEAGDVDVLAAVRGDSKNARLVREKPG